MTSGGSPLRHLALRYRRGLVLTAMLLSSSLLILFNGTPGVAKPQEIGLSVLGFFESMVSGVLSAGGQAGSSVGDLFDLKNKYEKAAAQLKQYEGSERTLVQLREENSRLREQLGFHQTLPYFNIPVEIVGKDPSKVYSSIVVNKGYLDGVRRDQPVVATQSGVIGLVGKVADVGLTSAVIQPILDANLFVAGRVENTRNEGLIAGRGTNEERLSMAYVKKSALNDLHIGDLIVTAGAGSLYPGDLPIGRIKAITSKEYQTSLDIELEPVLDFSRLEYLTILRPES
jgi:rod shape-determining protein MreC